MDNTITNYLYFWKPDIRYYEKGTEYRRMFGQWYMKHHSYLFKDDNGKKYLTTEHWMMAQKALLFNDKEIYKEIMKTESPSQVRNLGRKVKNFDPEIWDENKYNIVVQGNRYKFNQNKDLKEWLMSTYGQTLVEASPHDRIWGIGYEEKNAANNFSKWGENLLGKALMVVRQEIIEREILIN
jgi:ribA/ribD-fused uncharacterized protein